MLICVGLLQLPEPSRVFFAEIVRAWLGRPWALQATSIKTITPGLSDIEVAGTIGVSAVEVAANPSYRAIKKALGHVKLHKKPERRLKNAPYWAPTAMEHAPPPAIPAKRIVTGLLGLDEREFESFVRFWTWWRDLIWPRKAILIRSLLPDAHDRQIVELLNIRRETLQRHRLYRDFKLRNSPRRLTGGLLSVGLDDEDEDFRDDDLDDFEGAYTG